jgi:hypothetical protein
MPFDSPPVHGHAELLLNACDQFGDRQRRQCSALLEYEVQHGRRKFVRSVRAALVWDQPSETVLRNRKLSLIKRRT